MINNPYQLVNIHFLILINHPYQPWLIFIYSIATRQPGPPAARKPLIIGNLFDTATSYSWAQVSWTTFPMGYPRGSHRIPMPLRPGFGDTNATVVAMGSHGLWGTVGTRNHVDHEEQSIIFRLPHGFRREAAHIVHKKRAVKQQKLQPWRCAVCNPCKNRYCMCVRFQSRKQSTLDPWKKFNPFNVYLINI